MRTTRPPVSIAAERAVRFLRDRGEPVGSVALAEEVLSTHVPDEATARKILETAFAGDPRLVLEDGAWGCRTLPRSTFTLAEPRRRGTERVLILSRGRRPSAGEPFRLASVVFIRLEEDTVTGACGGDVVAGRPGEEMRRSAQEMLIGAVPVIHDPPGALAALERWLDEPLDRAVSLRRLGQIRLGLPANHDLETLASRLGLAYRRTEDPLDLAETLDLVLDALMLPGEDLEDLRGACHEEATPIEWSRYAFDREFLGAIPRVAGTYRFYDADGKLLYVGKSKNLHRRIGSYFRQGVARPVRLQALLRVLYRIEYEPAGSDLEAILREAAEIRKKKPERNVQREYRSVGDRADRLRSILILEPARPPWVLRAYLLRDGRIVDRVPIGPRGGGLRRIRRILEDRFFSFRPGPVGSSPGADVDVEIVARWLGAHRDQVVAFDPTNLRSADEVIARLRFFLDSGLSGPEGTPVLVR